MTAGRCRKCGYFDGDHELGTRKCPVCACGATPAEHAPNCPGKAPSEATGLLPTLRRGTFDPAPAREEPAWRPGPHAAAAAALVCFPMRSEWQAIAAKMAADVVRSLSPQVVARAPQGPSEIAGAGSKKQATKLGRAAVAAGWQVESAYWRAGDGTEGCALRLARGDVRAVALWQRKPGNVGSLVGWSAAEAYVWRLGVPGFPTKIAHAEVDDLLGTC